VTAIGDQAFYKCLLLNSVVIPNSVTSIGFQAFYRCESITSVTIPNSVTSISDEAFYNCKLLVSATILGDLTTIADGLFKKCYLLTSVTIPDTVTSISDNAFAECSDLASITIPDGVTSIGANAFFKCYEITSIALPAGMTSIGNQAFEKCTGLTEMSVAVVDPADITLGTDVFASSPIASATLTVPSGSVAAYEAAPQWSAFGSVVGETLGVNDDIVAASFSVYPNPVQNTLYIKHNSDQELLSVSVYDVQGKQVINSNNSAVDVASLAKGMYLVKITTSLGSTTKKLIKN
jgi:hypothetical protein